MEKEILGILWIVVKILCIVIPLLLAVAYMTYAERRVLGLIQDRIGPNRVGFMGLLQPMADGMKLFFKELIIPSSSNPWLFLAATSITFICSILAWAAIPFGWHLVLANMNAGILYVFAFTSLGVYGLLIAGWASNSKYALYGALRTAAQVISYELAMGFVLVGVVMAAGSLNLTHIVSAQQGGFWHWYWLPLLPLFVIYWICGMAETNRSPFDVVEGESEIVGGCHVEYSGMRFALFFLAEYANMILISALVSLFFLGGWLSPFAGIKWLDVFFAGVPGFIWLFLKMAFFLFLYIWVRGTLPRYRYDQLMRLGWKVFIPLTLFWLVVEAFMVKFGLGPWFSVS